MAFGGNSLDIGHVIGSDAPLRLAASARERHTYICGGTGVGKSKFIEYCVRQDILNWPKSRSGLILFDPHGLVCQNILSWLARHDLKRPVVPFDLRRDDWVISYNLLRRRKESDSAVVVSNFVRALAHVWGQQGTDQTPLFARWAGVILLTLYENGYTIADINRLIFRHDIRQAMADRMTDDSAREAWRFAERHPKDFEQQITSTLNRFQRLLGPQVMKAMFGQPDVSLDLATALDEGQIILVNLSTEGGQIDEEDADTFATLLLTDLWSAAKARGKQEREKTRPFYVYVDECQNFITPTIAKSLDQARGFGLHLTLANQFPSQFLNAGASGKAMYDSILANAGNKIVFRVEHPDDMESLAKSLFMGTFNTEDVKLKLESTKVVGYREEERQSQTTGSSSMRGRSAGRGSASFQGNSDADTESESEGINPNAFMRDVVNRSEAWNRAVASTSGVTDSWSESENEAETASLSVTLASMLIPIMGREVSSVQYRTIEEQLFRAMQTLFDQKDRQFAIRFHSGPKAPLFVSTPMVGRATASSNRIEEYRRQLLGNLSFALPMAVAKGKLSLRKEQFMRDALIVDEATTAKRRLR